MEQGFIVKEGFEAQLVVGPDSVYDRVICPAVEVFFPETRFDRTCPDSAETRAQYPQATPEVMAAYETLCEERAEKYAAQRAEYEAYEARERMFEKIEEAWTPEKGHTVVVFKGRKVPKGTVGEVFWVGSDSFGKPRVGIKTAKGETFFTARENCWII